MNKYRLAIMVVLIIMIFLYVVEIVDISDVTNFAFTCSSLIFSVSAVFDTFAKEHRGEKIIRSILDTAAILCTVLIPNLKDSDLINKLMELFDTNVLLLLALFFTMAGQWAVEIKETARKK